MSQVTFSISDLIEKGWMQFKSNPGFWIGITILTILVGSVGNTFDFNPETFEFSKLNPIGLVADIIGLYLSAAVTLMSIKFMQGKAVAINDLTSVDLKTFIQYFLVTIISTFLMIVGFMVFIIPGFYIMSRLIFVQYLVVDKKLNFDEAIKQSWRISDGFVLQFIAFFCAMIFVILVGLLAFLVGLLIAIPISMLASAQLYIIFTKSNIQEIE